MSNNLSDDPYPADGAYQGDPALSYAHCLAEITPQTPIGVMERARLTQWITDLLQPTLPHQHAMSVAVIYTVAAASPEARGQRVRSFLRWSAAYDAASGSADTAERLANQRLRDIFDETQAQLAAHYDLALAKREALSDALRVNPCLLPHAELRYTTWRPTQEWLGPTHVQPVLDQLRRQRGSAALCIGVERRAIQAAGGDARLLLSIVAMGEATRKETLTLFSDEVRGCGCLVVHTPRAMPTVEPFATQRHAYLSQFWGQHDERVDLTPAEAGLLVPLPMLYTL